MKITKDFLGMMHSKSGVYVIDGDLDFSEDLDIFLDRPLIVLGDIAVRGHIKSSSSIEAVGKIVSSGGIEIDGLIRAGLILSDKDIKAHGIESEFSVVAKGCIESQGIIAGGLIIAGTHIECHNRIFAGLCVFDNAGESDREIRCAELRDGTIEYGELIITKQEVTT